MEKPMTIKDIARIAGVSTATVSRVINNNPAGVSRETRAHIQQIVQTYGYQPNNVARSMITKRSNTIGVVVPDIVNQFYTLLLKGVEDMAASRGYSVVLCNSNNNEDKELRNLSYLRDNYVAGIIYNNYRMSERTANLIRSSRVPLIFVDNWGDPIDGICVRINHQHGMAAMANYLLDMGHRAFAYLAGPEGVFSADMRRRGFLDALEERGIPFAPRGVLQHCAYSEEAGYEAAKQLLDEKRSITCFVCANDLIAYGVIRLLNERGLRVPDDCSVTGFDDIPFSRLLNPGLTTIYNPVQQLGRSAAQLLIDHIEGAPPPPQRELLFDTHLVRRASVKFLPS